VFVLCVLWPCFGRAVGDVDAELEDVERRKAALELQRDEAQRRQARLR
jgi:hypothetical protein